MIDPLALLAFLPAGVALNLTPGPDMLFCLAQGLRSGPLAAWAASAGVALGLMVHVTLAGLGLGALIATMPAAFDAIRWAGVAYLLWLAAQSLRHGRVARGGGVTLTPARALRSGLIVNLTNPKVILFVLAFVPQFIVPEKGPVLFQFLIYGVMMALGGFVVNGLVGRFAAGAGQWIAGGSRWLDRITAALFTALAFRLALLEAL